MLETSPMRQSLCEKSFDRRNRLSHRGVTAWFVVVGQAVPPANSRSRGLFTQTRQRGVTFVTRPNPKLTHGAEKRGGNHETNPRTKPEKQKKGLFYLNFIAFHTCSLKAITGSTFVARVAGIRQAATATSVNKTAAIRKDAGSVEVTWNKVLLRMLPR